MSRLFPRTESSLSRTAAGWQWLRFLQHSATLGIVVVALILLLGLTMTLGWLSHPGAARALIVLLVVAALLSWGILFLVVLAGNPDRHWLARRIEQSQPGLLDRLNTLIFLDRVRHQPEVSPFYGRIAFQTEQVLQQQKAAAQLPVRGPLLRVAACLALIALAWMFYERFSPWQRMMAAQQAREAARQAKGEASAESPFEIPPPDTAAVEQKQTWGEVRITEPGRDLYVTKLDVVPLQIEAASSETLNAVSWANMVNGDDERQHPLPEPAEPRYAVYRPVVDLDELQLSDWDVLTYYANASAEGGASYASEIYFMEVRPFREDLMKMPGQAYQCLDELTALISRQQQIIRETHRHIQNPPEQLSLQAQDRKKLAEAETGLARATEHLRASMAAEMEDKPIGAALDHLARAEKQLDQAGTSLDADAMRDAQKQERAALAELVAARKRFQRVVSENPGAFPEPELAGQAPVADPLQRMAEFRDEAKAAEDFIAQAVQKQQQIAGSAQASSRTNYPALARDEQQLEQALRQFQQQHPRPFQNLQPQTSQVQQAMERATQDLQRKSAAARTNTQEAARQLENLQQTMKEQNTDRQLVDAYRLKEMLDRQIAACSACQQSPGSFGSSQLAQTASQARQTLRQMKQMAEQSPGREAFGQPLREALSDANLPALNQSLDELAQAQGEPGKAEAAGKAKDALSRVSEAFEKSQPESLQMARETESLQPDAREAMARGLGQLESLLEQLEGNRPPSPGNQARQAGEALFNLQTGLRESWGGNERGNQVLLRLEQELKKGEERPLDAAELRKLLDELQDFSLELAGRSEKPQEESKVVNIDPAKLPPAYRGRIEKYFQKLSEQ